jgi:hypothetical protein
VPAEAHRLERRFGPRDRLIIATILTVTAIAVVGSLFVHEQNPDRGSTQCVTYNDAGVMGGGTWRLCGTDANKFCKQQPKVNAAAGCATLLRQRQTAHP